MVPVRQEVGCSDVKQAGLPGLRSTVHVWDCKEMSRLQWHFSVSVSRFREMAMMLMCY
jgi:hypothetical protein